MDMDVARDAVANCWLVSTATDFTIMCNSGYDWSAPVVQEWNVPASAGQIKITTYNYATGLCFVTDGISNAASDSHVMIQGCMNMTNEFATQVFYTNFTSRYPPYVTVSN